MSEYVAEVESGYHTSDVSKWIFSVSPTYFVPISPQSHLSYLLRHLISGVQEPPASPLLVAHTHDTVDWLVHLTTRSFSPHVEEILYSIPLQPNSKMSEHR